MESTIEKLKGEVKWEVENGSSLDFTNWGSQDGILISVQDGINILDIFKATQALLFMMGEKNYNSHGAKTVDEAIIMANKAIHQATK